MNINLTFLDYKKLDLTKSPNLRFPKVLVHGFCEKILFSLFFLFRQNRPNKSLGYVLDRELPFLDYKKIDVKTRIYIFLEGKPK